MNGGGRMRETDGRVGRMLHLVFSGLSALPTPAAWLRMRFSWASSRQPLPFLPRTCSSCSFSFSMTVLANLPKPVVMPYTTLFSLTILSMRARLSFTWGMVQPLLHLLPHLLLGLLGQVDLEPEPAQLHQVVDGQRVT